MLVCIINISGIVESIECDAKSFAHDTSLFSVAKNADETASGLHRNLEGIQLWPYQWKMTFNGGKTEEVIFFLKKETHSSSSFPG